MSIRILEVVDPHGQTIDSEWLARAEPVHRQLRPRMPADYAAKMARVFAGGGRMCVALDEEEVVAVAVYRIYENTFDGRQMYVDDLVTDERKRSLGIGKRMLEHLRTIARDTGCVSFNLDSGTQRLRAHQFYFREGLVIDSFHFVQPVLE